MKALVINKSRAHYGFVIEVERTPDGLYYDDAGHFAYEERELQFQWQEKDFDWSSFRREAAKNILPVLIDKASDVYGFEALHKEVWCQQAIEYANELIKRLKDEK